MNVLGLASTRRVLPALTGTIPGTKHPTRYLLEGRLPRDGGSDNQEDERPLPRVLFQYAQHSFFRLRYSWNQSIIGDILTSFRKGTLSPVALGSIVVSSTVQDFASLMVEGLTPPPRRFYSFLKQTRNTLLLRSPPHTD
jgi:hypothetical protein